MHSVNSTILKYKKTILLIIVVFSYHHLFAQENSPYTRYGIGDVVPTQNMVSRSMGGISAGFVDNTTYFQSINLTNPSSLASLNPLPYGTIFDLGGEIDSRTLRSNNSPDKFKSVNTLVSYLQFAFPISTSKMLKKGNNWVVGFGLKPATRINYKIDENKRLTGIDSINTLYEGNGGINQANFSTAIRIKHLNIGLTTGYAFGNREISTKLNFINDTVPYKFSNTKSSARFGGIFLNIGAQYDVKLDTFSTLRIGATANLQQSLKATRDVVAETFRYASDGTLIPIDTVQVAIEENGKIIVPASYTLGFTITNKHWVIGADVDYAQWANYRNYGVKDPLQNTFKVRFGAQFFPATAFTPISKKLQFIKYRAGFYYGNDYVKLNTNRPDFALTLGAGIPLTSLNTRYAPALVALNTGIEIGQRGNKTNLSIREGIFRVNIGLSISTAWFQKRKYD